jgi:hypothetical protein
VLVQRVLSATLRLLFAREAKGKRKLVLAEEGPKPDECVYDKKQEIH